MEKNHCPFLDLKKIQFLSKHEILFDNAVAFEQSID